MTFLLQKVARSTDPQLHNTRLSLQIIIRDSDLMISYFKFQRKTS